MEKRNKIFKYLTLILITLNTNNCSYYNQYVKKSFPISTNDEVVKLITKDGKIDDLKIVNIKELPDDNNIKINRYKMNSSNFIDGYNTIKPIKINSDFFILDGSRCITSLNINNLKKVNWRKCYNKDSNEKNIIKNGFMNHNKKNIFFIDGYNYIKAINYKNGDLVWKLEISSLTRGEIITDEKNLYFTTNDNKIYSVNQETGTINWMSSPFIIPFKLLSSPQITINGNNLILLIPNKIIFIYNKNNGYIIKNINIDEKKYTYSNYLSDFTDKPIIVNNDIIISSYDNNTKKINNNGETIWSIPLYSNNNIVNNKNNIIMIDQNNNLVSINKESGKINWKNKINIENIQNKILGVSDRLYGPILIKNQILICTRNGFIIMFDQKTGNPINKIKINRGIQNTPVVYDEILYVYTPQNSSLTTLNFQK